MSEQRDVAGFATGTMLGDLLVAEETRPEHPLIRWRDGEWTTSDFARAARGAGRALRDMGIRPGDRVGTMAGNSPQHLAVWYGIQFAGGVVAPINPEHRGDFLRHIVEDSDPQCVVAEVDYHKELKDLGLKGVRIVDVADVVPSDLSDDESWEVVEPRPDDLAVISYTSGTTGPSKGAMIPFGYYTNHARIGIREFGLGPDDVFYIVNPIFHVDAHVWLAACIQSGGTFSFAKKFSASQYWQEIKQFGVTYTGLVGFALDVLAVRDAPSKKDLSRLRFIFGAPIPQRAYEFFEDKLGIPIYQVYGQTELYCPIFSNEQVNRRGAAGRAIEEFDVRIMRPDGESAETDEVGEICCRPLRPNLMTPGYWNRAEATVASIKDLWWHTADTARMDSDGFVWFAQRETDSIRRRGEFVSAYELESALRNIPGVMDCAAVGVKDPLGGEAEIKVFVVVDEEESAFDVTRFFEEAEQRLPAHAVPRYVEVLSENDVVRSPGTMVIQKHRLPTEHTEKEIDRTKPLQ